MSLEAFVRDQIYNLLNAYAEQAIILGNKHIEVKKDGKSKKISFYGKDLKVKTISDNPNIYINVEIAYENSDERGRLGVYLEKFMAPQYDNIFTKEDSPLKHFVQYLDFYAELIPEVSIIIKGSSFEISARTTEQTLKKAKMKIENLQEQKQKEKNPIEINNIETKIKILTDPEGRGIFIAFNWERRGRASGY